MGRLGDAVVSKGACSFLQQFPPASLGRQEGRLHRTLNTKSGQDLCQPGEFKGRVAAPRTPAGKQATSLDGQHSRDAASCQSCDGLSTEVRP